MPETEGVALYLEPLNRYEDHMVNRLADRVSLLEEVGLASVRLGADTYHMNIEEADPAAALESAGPGSATSRSVTPTGSSRAGHVDWAAICASLKTIGYDGPVALESRLSGPAEDVLPRVPVLLRQYL